MEYPEYYKILELPIDAELADIKRQYRKCAKKYHPDLNKGDKNAEEMFKKVKEAYETLTDENKRAAYDLSWKKQRDNEKKTRSKTTAQPKPQKKQEPQSPKPKTTQKPQKYRTKKAVRPLAKIRSFLKILRIFFFSSLICGILFVLTLQIIENKEQLVKFTTTLSEMSDGPENYFIKKSVIENDVSKIKQNLQNDEKKSIPARDVVNLKNSDGYSLLMLSTTAEMSKLLIDNGAEVNYVAPDGKTALLFAVKNNNKAQVEVLLKAGAKAEIKDAESGYNALMLSQSNDIAYLLLKAGANPNFVAADGLTPLAKATKEHDRQRLNLLHQFGARINWSDVIIR